jgi:hypothetical protein
MEKQELLETKTSTPALKREDAIEPMKPKPPTPAQRDWEERKAQDREDHHRMRERHVEKSQHWGVLKAHRMARAQRRNRIAVEAMVGVYTGPSEPMSEAERLEFRAELEVLRVEREARLGMAARRHDGGTTEVTA